MKIYLISLIILLTITGCTRTQPVMMNNTSDKPTINTTNDIGFVVDNTNTAIDTSDWKTYEDKVYKFTFQYPVTWQVNIEQTQLSSRIIDDAYIYVIQLLHNNVIQLAILPEGQLDHDLDADMLIKKLIIDQKPVTERYSDNYQVYFFDDFPKQDSEFRIESHIDDVKQKEIIDTIVKSIHFNL